MLYRHAVLPVFALLTFAAPQQGTKPTPPPRPRAEAAVPVAAERPATRVAVVNIAALEQASGVESVETYQERRVQAVAAKYEEIRSRELRIAAETKTLTPELRDQLQTEIRRLKQELDQEQKAAFQDVQKQRTRRHDVVMEHIAKVAAAQGIQLVLNRSEAAVAWTDATIDITKDVVASMKAAAK
jgi:Skp family chaperone for outer membrane proteins